MSEKVRREYRGVSIIMITKDEEDAVASVIDDIEEDAPGAEIVIVDSSIDNTASIAREKGACVVRQYPPKGYAAAMVRGFMESKNEIVVTMDCDNTYPTDAIPDLVKLIRNGYSVVGATRISCGRPQHMPLTNYYANLVFNAFATLCFAQRIKDIHTGMRAYKRTVLEQIEWDVISGGGAAFPVDLYLKPMRLGYKVVEIPIEYHERSGETKLNRWHGTKWTLRRIIKCRFDSAM